MKTTGNTILVTGGGSGNGRALARLFHDGGNVVIVAGRRQQALDETIDGRTSMSAITLDLEDADTVTAFARRVTEHPALNVLVNNAGVMRVEDLSRPRDLADESTVMTNLLAPIRLTNGLIEHLSGQADAVIVNQLVAGF